ncbi:Rv0518 family GDSL lipase [Mycobacterium sp. NPDC003323]
MITKDAVRRFPPLLLVAALLWVAIPGPSTQLRPLTVETPLSRVAVIGDSYTNGTDWGGIGGAGWPARAWDIMAAQGRPVVADVAAEGRAGYGVRGDRGSLFWDLTTRAVRPDDRLIVFFGSRNDQPVPVTEVVNQARAVFELARAIAPRARMLVIGPPWPTADVPVEILRIRDALAAVARSVGARFVDPLAEGWFVGRPDLIAADGVHPTDAGHLYMAEKIARLMGAQLTPSR